MSQILQRFCLKPSNSLRLQLIRNYGIACCLTLAAAVTLACVYAHVAGETVRERTDEVLRQQVVRSLILSTRLASERIALNFDMLEGSVHLLAEAVRDRIVGYPEPGWENDSYVPFFDVLSKSNKYPLQAASVPLDWNITLNVNEQNARNHLPNRLNWSVNRSLSTASGSYFMAGSCDPAATDPEQLGFYPNCRDANNNLTTGGVVIPSNTSWPIYKKAADLVPLMKAIFEKQPELIQTGIYFHNSGAGTAVSYPGYIVNRNDVYVSAGCSWLREVNNLTGRPFGTDDDIKRCHPQGTNVAKSEYNALDREWYREAAMNRNRVMWIGPDRDLDFGYYVLNLVRSVFDRKTGNLIGAVSLDIDLTVVSKYLQDLLLHRDLYLTDIAVVRLSDAAVIVDTLDSRYATNRSLVRAYETEMGLTKSDYEKLKGSLDVFNKYWTPKEVAQTLADNFIIAGSRVLTADPIPVPPDNYSPDYQPQFLVIQSLSQNVFSVIGDLKHDIHNDLRKIVFVSIGVGVAGMVVMFTIIWCVSRMLTQPLLWIEKVAWNIVNHAEKGADRVLSDGDEDIFVLKCTPATEITELVREFRSMITGFSGTGPATVAQSTMHEVHNEVTWRSGFHQFYSRVAEKKESTKSAVSSKTMSSTEVDEVVDLSSFRNRNISAPEIVNDKPLQDDALATSIVLAPPKKNLDANVKQPSGSWLTKDTLSKSVDFDEITVYRSRLFWCILLLIVFPLLVTNGIICAVVFSHVIQTVPSWVSIVERSSFNLELSALASVVSMIASSTAGSLELVNRDLFVVNRFAGWLFFGGLPMSSAFVEVDEATEECKFYAPNKSDCPYFSSKNTPCECDWNDSTGSTCTNYTGTDSRYLQRRFFAAQKNDADNVTGNRHRFRWVDYPKTDYSPNTTLWWSSSLNLPGSQNGGSSKGYVTSFARMRVASAMSAVEIPIYNYFTNLPGSVRHYGTYIGFEADGAFTGYEGCLYSYPLLSHWQSRSENPPAGLYPVCPTGKFGYDSRCTEWYDQGKKKYLAAQRSVYITVPIECDGGAVWLTATSPIANPITAQYVGQSRIDFKPKKALKAFAELKYPIAFMITADADITGGNTVLGPYANSTFSRSLNILDQLFPFENSSSINRLFFRNKVLPKTFNGSLTKKVFHRTSESGMEEEYYLCTEPIVVQSDLTLCPNDFSCGVNTSQSVVYILGMARKTTDLKQPFREVDNSVIENLEDLQLNYIVAVAVLSLFFTLYTFMITSYITLPLIILLRVVQAIHTGRIDEDIPPLTGGSREVHQIYSSLAKLIKTVRMSNVSFFSGNLTRAFEFVSDALMLFRKVNDTKAIGIACNNVGNIMYAILRGSTHSMNLSSEIEIGLRHYDESIDIACDQFKSAAIVEEGDFQKADFALQLADRLFNYGMFLLHIHGREGAPLDARTRGLGCIRKTMELDYDVYDLWLERKKLLEKSAHYFDRMIRRTHGLIDLYDDEEVRDLWDPSSLLLDCNQVLTAAWKEQRAALFDMMTPAGRLQQLEAAAIRLYLLIGDTNEAGKLAMRMFAEDEYLLEFPFATAATALLHVIRESDPDPWSTRTKTLIKQDLRSMLRRCRNMGIDLGKCLVMGIEINERLEGDPIMDLVRTKCLHLYDTYCASDDYLGIVAYTTKGDMNVDISLKRNHAGRQRSRIEDALSLTSDRSCPALPFAVQMIVDSAASIENDSYILLIVDGFSWDPAILASMRGQIERLNQERNTQIHVFIIGLDVEDEEAVADYKLINEVSRLSFYSNLTPSNADEVFANVAGMICGRANAPDWFQSITMERF